MVARVALDHVTLVRIQARQPAHDDKEVARVPDYKFTIVAERDEDGLYVASVPLLQGCYTQGETYEEALENVKDAIRLHIEARRELDEPIPIEVGIDEVRVIA